MPRCRDKKASIQYFLPVTIIKDLKRPVSRLASHFICNTSYIFLLAVEFSDHLLVTNNAQKLYQTLQATNVNFEKTVRVTSFQKPKCNPFQMFSIFFSFEFIHPSSLLCFLCCFFLLMFRAVGGNSPVWN